MKLIATILTCPMRKEALAKTLENLSATDWGEEPLIFCDSLNMEDRQLSQTVNAHHLLMCMDNKDWDWLLFLEDDLEFNRFIRYNVLDWLPKLNSPVATLYGCEGDAMILAGSQAILIRRDGVKSILDGWNGFTTEMQDLRIYRSLKHTIPCHQPNLVNHRSESSTWGGGCHTSKNFNADWKS